MRTAYCKRWYKYCCCKTLFSRPLCGHGRDIFPGVCSPLLPMGCTPHYNAQFSTWLALGVQEKHVRLEQRAVALFRYGGPEMVLCQKPPLSQTHTHTNTPIAQVMRYLILCINKTVYLFPSVSIRFATSAVARLSHSVLMIPASSTTNDLNLQIQQLCQNF